MHTPTSYADLENELNEVQQMLRDAVDGLGSPLGDIVRAQAKRAFPPARAAVVLASAVADRGDTELRDRRLALAAALEMLYIALQVHRLLIGAPADAQADERASLLDRSFIGSAILSGDYCFSRAAQFAAAADNAHVAAIFAQALQVVSEGQLRRQFGQPGTSAPAADDGTGYDETGELLRSGVLAAAALVGAAPEEEAALARLSQEIAARWLAHKPFALADTGLQSRLSPARSARWHALQLWLAAQSVNGRLATASSPFSR